MARPRREDRETVADTTLTIRLTAAEREGLEALVARKQEEMRQAFGPGATMTMAGYIRALIAREVEAMKGGG